MALHLPVTEIANTLPEGVYFTRITLFTTMFIIIVFGVFIEKHVNTKLSLDW